MKKVAVIVCGLMVVSTVLTTGASKAQSNDDQPIIVKIEQDSNLVRLEQEDQKDPIIVENTKERRTLWSMFKGLVVKEKTEEAPVAQPQKRPEITAGSAEMSDQKRSLFSWLGALKPKSKTVEDDVDEVVDSIPSVKVQKRPEPKKSLFSWLPWNKKTTNAEVAENTRKDAIEEAVAAQSVPSIFGQSAERFSVVDIHDKEVKPAIIVPQPVQRVLPENVVARVNAVEEDVSKVVEKAEAVVVSEQEVSEAATTVLSQPLTKTPVVSKPAAIVEKEIKPVLEAVQAAPSKTVVASTIAAKTVATADAVTVDAVTANRKEPVIRLVFKSGDVALSEAMKQAIVPALEIAKAGQRLRVLSYATQVNGKAHTDRRIALQRAITVRSHFIDYGIASSQIAVQALGQVEGEAARDEVVIEINRAD